VQEGQENFQEHENEESSEVTDTSLIEEEVAPSEEAEEEAPTDIDSQANGATNFDFGEAKSELNVSKEGTDDEVGADASNVEALDEDILEDADAQVDAEAPTSFPQEEDAPLLLAGSDELETSDTDPQLNLEEPVERPDNVPGIFLEPTYEGTDAAAAEKAEMESGRPKAVPEVIAEVNNYQPVPVSEANPEKDADQPVTLLELEHAAILEQPVAEPEVGTEGNSEQPVSLLPEIKPEGDSEQPEDSSEHYTEEPEDDLEQETSFEVPNPEEIKQACLIG
jgi:hypothetical protein